MSQLLLSSIICHILDLTAARSLHNSGSVHVAQQVRTYLNCSSGQYEANGVCCDLCEPGYVVKSLDCRSNPKTNCKPCTVGKDYMDKDNYKTTCLRCNFCDEQHGMETEKHCTITQNVKCRCRIGFFCDSTKPCRHCEKCDLCENGIIAKECTPTQNTVCGEKDNTKDSKHRTERRQKITNQKGTYESYEDKKIEYPDINLKPYIPAIISVMEVRQVRRLVRKLGLSTVQIDGIVYENSNDSSEQKIKLLECWHETHGIKGSCQTLITSLRELKFDDAADNIDQIIEGKCNHPED
ncbi:tumor necrosis factor receptor superfamily member 6 isoform X2 [Erythrolamprus reginae]|uniref:tumor necrosis factor receptor superfamily member 6 isoform X2 n=1 Tax=Erythrolamprus reginae TaxID=121349 RepID=UPI00396CD1FD